MSDETMLADTWLRVDRNGVITLDKDTTKTYGTKPIAITIDITKDVVQKFAIRGVIPNSTGADAVRYLNSYDFVNTSGDETLPIQGAINLMESEGRKVDSYNSADVLMTLAEPFGSFPVGTTVGRSLTKSDMSRFVKFMARAEQLVAGGTDPVIKCTVKGSNYKKAFDVGFVEFEFI